MRGKRGAVAVVVALMARTSVDQAAVLRTFRGRAGGVSGCGDGVVRARRPALSVATVLEAGGRGLVVADHVWR
jgi:hypothetical protein